MNEKMMIPRVIHYCWFGGNPLPEEALRCIESWKRYCPDCQIIRWDESNYDVNCCDYVREAYEMKKWAFVSDYARFDILYRYGGLYFDTDVELIKPLDDILERGGFLGVEQPIGENTSVKVAPGLGMASAASHPLYRELLEQYRKIRFLNPDGSLNRVTVVEYTTDLLREHGLRNADEIQCVQGIYIYPQDYFCPMHYRTGKLTITENTRSIHHYSATWFSKQEQAEHKLVMELSGVLGEKPAVRIGRIYSFPYRVRMKLKQKGLLGTCRFALQKLTNKVK